MLMRRKSLILLVFVAGIVGGFHEWTPPARATSPNFCDSAPPEEQFDSTYATDNDGTGHFFVGVNGQARFICTTNWRVTMIPLFKLPADSSWTVGFDNALYFPSINGHYATNQDVFFQPGGSTPPGFTGYWTNGDGLRAAHPICRYQWRVRERFTNTGNGTTEGTLYSPTVEPTC
jgi:ribosomal protein L24E